MFNRVKYALQRARSKGLLNLCSAVSRVFLGGHGAPLFSNAAWLRQRWRSRRSPSFKIIAIETMAGCNYRCSFCPLGKVDLPKGSMSRDLFLNLLDQLKNFDGCIHMFLFNEPLLDPRLSEFVKLAREKTKASVVIQTNGSKLTSQLAADLCGMSTLIVNDYSPDHSIAEFVESLPRSRNLIVLRRGTDEVLTNRAGNLPDRPPKRLNAFCIRPFEQMYVAHDGRVVLCCQDWSFEAVVGDANCDSLQAIWESPEYEKYRSSLLKRNRVGLCSKCDFPGV